MRRTRRVAGSLLVALAILAALGIDHESVVRAHGTAVGTGDTNGDGRLDLSDAVYLLTYLFSGGPEPAAVDCPSSTVTLLDSGQARCYDGAHFEVPCGIADPPGQDGAYRLGCEGSAEGRFIAGEGGTVIDTCTGLEWQLLGNSSPSLFWFQALHHADQAILAADGSWLDGTGDPSAHGGVLHDDWRLPSVRELETLIDFGRYGPAVPEGLSVSPGGHWSSTSFANSPDRAWCVNFLDGKVEPIQKVASLRVVLVRTRS